MKHPEMVRREREEQLRKLSNRYWYRWMGLYSLALIAVVALIYAAHHEAHGATVSMVSGMFGAGIGITAWLARQRAIDELKIDSSATELPQPVDR